MTTADLAAAKYVSLTTFKRDGTPVAAPVWIAGDGDDLVVITEAGSWKMKRLANDPRVQLSRCDARGKVAAGATTYEGTAEAATGAEAERISEMIQNEYGLLGKLMPHLYKIRALVTRKPAPEAAGIVISLADE